MKRTYLYTIFFLFELLTLGCSKDDNCLVKKEEYKEEYEDFDCQIKDSILNNDDMLLLMQCAGNTKISEEEVMQAAEEARSLFSNNIYKSSRVNVSNQRKINYRGSISKSTGKLDSIPVYFLNYEDGGFAVISGDTRLPRILAFSAEGTYEDDGGSGYTDFLQRLPMYVIKTVDSVQNRYESKKDSIFNVLESYIPDSCKKQLPISKVLQPIYSPEREPGKSYITMQTIDHRIYKSDVHENFLSTVWHQNSPFNNRAPICTLSKEHMPAGCVVIALGQILAYHQYPSSINGYYFNWTNILSNKYGQNDTAGVARLCLELGRLVNLKYGCDGSSSNINKTYKALQKIGYSSNSVMNFTETSIIFSLQNNRPVFIVGTNYINNVAKDGHAWVIDGMFIMNDVTTKMTALITAKGPINPHPESINYRTLFLHCNYGHLSNKPIYAVSEVFKEILGGEDYLWTNCQIITNIRH